jgi:hypothetical protein
MCQLRLKDYDRVVALCDNVLTKDVDNVKVRRGTPGRINNTVMNQ